MERKALGRGLSSLVGGLGTADNTARVLQIQVDEIQPNPRQPRQDWDEDALGDLAGSIKVDGVLQPLIVRGRPGSYELIAGERRLRAARMAGLTTVPAILREIDDEGSLRLALIENIQREDISPLDAARAYQQLMEQFAMTQEDVARAVGKSRPAIANTLRLLRLPAPILESLAARSITEGHARTLLAVEDPVEQDRLWKLASGGASVREIEAAVRADRPGATPEGEAGSKGGNRLKTTVRRDTRSLPHLEALADQLRRSLGVKVEIRGDDHSGMVCLEYYSADDLQVLADRLLHEPLPDTVSV